jgi:hypothetical protein
MIIILTGSIMAQDSENIASLPSGLTYLYLQPSPKISLINNFDYICLDKHSRWYFYHIPSDVKKTLSIPGKAWTYPYTKQEYKIMIEHILGKERLNKMLNNK